MSTMEAAPSQEAVEAFVGKVLGDFAGHMAANLGVFGDQLGLWRVLAERGAANSVELAERAGIDERYAREWLAGVTAAGYLTYDSSTGRYAMPAAHVPVLATEGAPYFFGGAFQEVAGMGDHFDELIAAFRRGGGVDQSRYNHHMFAAIARFTNGWFENLLIPVWIPAMPDVQKLLERGVKVADIGCGAGKALIKLATTYPEGTYVGYDNSPEQLALAAKEVEAAGLSDRVRFELLDASEGLPEQYDVITTFDVLHDSVDPAGLLAAIRQALRPGGRYVCVDINSSDDPEQNVGPLATLLYGTSIMYCMTVSLARGGAGLGTCGLHPKKLEELAAQAGFGEVRLAPVEDPFNNLYEITA